MKSRIVIGLIIAVWPQLLTAGPVVSGHVYTQWYEQYKRDLNDRTSRAAQSYAGGQMYIRRLMVVGKGRIDFFGAGRTTQLMSREAPNDPHSRLYQAYLKYTTARLDLRAGRQFLRGGNGARTGDGVRMALTLHRQLQLVTFGAASVDWLDPQARPDFDNFLWAGARLQLRAGDFRFAPAILWERRHGHWQRQDAGFDLSYRGLRHEADWGVFFDTRRSVLDELRLSYTWRVNSTWRLPVRYSLRTPNLEDRDYSLLPQLDDDLAEQQRSMISIQPQVSLGSRTSFAAEFSVVLSGDHRRYRHRYSLTIQRLAIQYLRHSGHGPAEDRVMITGRRKIHSQLEARAALSLAQIHYSTPLLAYDRRASSGRLGLTWTPVSHVSMTGEAQVLDTDQLKYQVRGFGRLQIRFGGGR